MSDWAFPQTIELADGTKCVRLEDFLKNEGYKELYEVAKGRIEQLQSERDELRDTVADVLLALGAFDYEGPRMAALRVVAERKSLQDQRDFCMGEIERLRKERDEAREALRLLFNYFKEWDEAADIAGLDLEGADAVQPAIKILQQMEDTNPTTKSKQVSSKLVVIKTASNL